MGSENSAKRTGTGLKESAEYQKRMLSASFEIRIFNLLVAMIVLAVMRTATGADVPRQVVLALCAWLFISAAYLFVFKSGILRTLRSIDNTHFSYYFAGVSCASLVIHYLGGAGMATVIIYFFDLIYANVLMRRLKGALVTAFIGISYFILLFLEGESLIAHQAVLVLFALLSYSTGLFSKMKEERENVLIDSKDRFAAKSERMEDIARVLRKKMAENRYLRRATMGYLAKKEFEVAEAKKDLQEQIEKLRKTQKSMFFMIEDLNEMSAQLKDARDHLEDKVRERTDELMNISTKLHRSERLAFLGRLAGSVTHELRNPLAIVKNASYYLNEVLKRDKDEKIRKHLSIIDKEVARIGAIVDNIMGFARTKPAEPREISLRELVEKTISSVDIPELVEIKKHFKEVPRIEVDADQLLHALMNITNNAIIAMSGNGMLTFRIYAEKEHICIEVEDTGSGIPPEQREVIFEPLYSSRSKGTGLGLPIAKMMVERQGGRIEFESEVDKGSVFRILLPKKTEGQTGNDA